MRCFLSVLEDINYTPDGIVISAPNAAAEFAYPEDKPILIEETCRVLLAPGSQVYLD